MRNQAQFPCLTQGLGDDAAAEAPDLTGAVPMEVREEGVGGDAHRGVGVGEGGQDELTLHRGVRVVEV